MSLSIADGFTVTATIKGVPGLYKTCRAKLRPATADDTLDYDGALGKAERKAAAYQLVSAHVKEIQPEGEAAERLVPEAVGKLPHRLYTELLNLVLGFGSFDAEGAEKNSG